MGYEMANTSAIFFGAYTKLLTAGGLYLTPTQRLGVGTNSPDTPIHILNAIGNTNVPHLKIIDDTTPAAGNNFNQDIGGSISLGTRTNSGNANRNLMGWVDGKKEGTTNGFTKGYLAFSTNDGDQSTTLDNKVERMRITSAGLVGVGTTAPAARLHVDGATDSLKMIVQGGVGQTLNLQEWRDSNATPLAYITAAGGFHPTSMGLGTAPQPGYLMYCQNSWTSTASVELTPAQYIGINTPTTPSGSYVFGLKAQAQLNGTQLSPAANVRGGSFDAFSNVSGSCGLVVGLAGTAYNNGTGTVNNCYGLLFSVSNQAGGTILNSYGMNVSNYIGSNSTTNYHFGIYVTDSTVVAGSTLSAQYGLYITSMTAGGANYAIYTNTGLNQLGDATLMTVPVASSVPLTVRGYTAQSANLQVWQNSTPTVLSCVDSLGRIGIGTASPGCALDITASAQAALFARIVNSNTTGTVSHAYLRLQTAGYQKGSPKLLYTIDNQGTWSCGFDCNDLKFKIANTAELQTGTKLTITDIGAVGMGTTAPAGRIHVGSDYDVDHIKAILQASTTQTKDYLQCQDKSTAIIASIDALGCAKFTGQFLGQRTVTSAPTITNGDYTLFCDATSAGFTVALPAAATNAGRVLIIKKIDSSGNAVTIDGNASETIDGALTLAISAQYVRYTLQCNGSNWYIV